MSKSSWERFFAYTIFGSLPRNATRLLSTLSSHISALEIQRDRILQDIESLSTNAVTSGIATGNLYDRSLTDITFYIVTWANVAKTLKRLSGLLADARLDRVIKRRTKWFEEMRAARNDLEHLDRVAAESSQNSVWLPIYLLGHDNSTIVICGKKLDVSAASFRRIDALELDLERWLKGIPPQKGGIFKIPKKSRSTNNRTPLERAKSNT